MMLLEFTALSEAGELVVDTLYVADKDQLKAYLEKHHLSLVTYKKLKAYGWRAVPMMDVAEFILRLAVLLEAGRPLLSALEDVQHSLSHTYLRYASILLIAQLKQGIDFIEGLKAFPKIFDPIVIQTIERGMKSGKLGEHMGKAHTFLQQKIEHQKRFKKVTLYPAFLLITMVVMFFGFIQFLLPEVVHYMEEMGVKELPLASRLLMGTKDFAETHGWLILTFIGTLALGIMGFVTHSRVQRFLTPLALKIPIVGEFYKRLSLLPWFCTVGELYGVGVDFKKSLEEGKQSIKNLFFQEKIQNMHDALLEGKPLVQVMKASDLFSSFTIALCDLGMKSGNLSSFFLKAYQFEQNALHASITRFLGLLEPLLIMLMGSLLLWLVMAVILPLYGNLNL